MYVFATDQPTCLVNTISGSGYGGQFTQIHINWPDPSIRVEVRPNWRDRKGLRGVQDIETGSAYFDHKFTVRGNSETEVRAFLSEGVQWYVDRLSQLLGNGDILVGIQRGRLLIRKASLIQKFAELEELVQLSLALFDQAMLTRSVGIEFVEETSLQMIADGRRSGVRDGSLASRNRLTGADCKPP